MIPMTGLDRFIDALAYLPAQVGARSTEQEFNQIFTVFLILGTLVGIVVIAYMSYLAFRYRSSRDTEGEKVAESPKLGELPKGSGGGRKLLLSFTLSAVIVISLVFWTYGSLLYIEDGPDVPDEDDMDIEVKGYQWGWDFEYPNGHVATNTLRVPENTVIFLDVTSRDVWHNFGIPNMGTKADAIPGHYTTTWFLENETGTYHAACYELCGAGHSGMNAEIVVMDEEEFEEWYSNTSSEKSSKAEP